MEPLRKTPHKLRIIYLLASNAARGGVKIQIEHCHQLAALGHDVKIISACSPPEWIEIKIPWEKVDISEGEILGGAFPACDIVVFSFYEQAYALQRAAKDSGAIPVYFAQGDEMIFGDAGSAESPQMKSHIIAAQNSLKFYYPLLTVSREAARKLKQLGGKEAVVIPNGIDTEIFYPQAKSKGSTLRILAVGSETPRFKGIAELYAALIKMKRDPLAPPFTFVRASPQPDRFARLPLETEFHQNPTQKELARLYSSADIFVGPSQNESFYLPPLEAMACGTAVCCSALPSVAEYAEAGRDYLSFSAGNIPEMYAVIKTLLNDSNLRNQLAKAGMQVAEKMAWPQIAGRLEDYFYGLLKNKGKIIGRLEQDLENPPFSFSLGSLK